MPSETYYKVVRIFLGRGRSFGIYSCCATERALIDEPDDVVQYRVGDWVKPKIEKSKLFVFGTLEHARSFEESICLPDIQKGVFVCEVQKPKKITKICVNSHHDWEFWANYNRKTQDLINITRKSPIGSIGCDAVKLIRKI